MKIFRTVIRKNREQMYQEARRLSGLFFDGRSTIEQERRLQELFALCNPMPADLEPMRAMLEYLDSGICNKKSNGSSRRKVVRRLSYAVAATMTGVIAMSVGYALSTPRNDNEVIFAGSYVIRNNEKITDIDLIVDDLLEAEKTVERLSALASPSPGEEAYRAALEEISDPECVELIIESRQ